MNGIRYTSRCLRFGAPHKLLRILSRRCCHESLSEDNALGSSSSTVDSQHTPNSVAYSDAIADAPDELRKVAAMRRKYDISTGPDLADFILANASTKIKGQPSVQPVDKVPYVKNINGENRSVYFDIYGCQMNVNDADVVWAILQKSGYKRSHNIETADIVLVVTCAIRDGAEEKIWNKLNQLKGLKAKRRKNRPMKIGILGCMAERLKSNMFTKNNAIDVVAGPDSYKDLPRLLALTENNETAINVILSFDETYADITPVRLNSESLTAFVTIMRGCDNMCTYCIVPFTRGKERARPISSIIDEVRHLSDQGIKEVTLLGQNVNSYRDLSQSNFYTGDKAPTNLAKGFKTVYKPKLGGVRFSDLLDQVSLVNPEMRIRFTSPHPKDFPDEVLHLIAERPNICRQLHLPAQSGNTEVLQRMRRGYTREAYLELVEHVRSIIPNVSLSSDFIAGFCGETDEEFEDTLTLMNLVEYNKAYLFAYSMREKTTAHRRFDDNVSASVKKDRLRRMIDLWTGQAEKLNGFQIGSQQLVLIESKSKRSDEFLSGRNDGNTRVIIPNGPIPINSTTDEARTISPGDYVVVQIYKANSNTLSGIPLYHSTISSYVPQMEDRKLVDNRSRCTT